MGCASLKKNVIHVVKKPHIILARRGMK